MENEQPDAVNELHDEETVAPTAGSRLIAAREAKGLELSHISAETRIPVRHLEAIELGKYDLLPSRTYAIGFSKNYARAVGLDKEEIAGLVREELADGHGHQSAMAGGMEPGDPAKLPSKGLAWFGAFAAIILAVGIMFFYNTYFGAGTGPAPLVADADQSENGNAEAVAGSANSASGEDVSDTAVAAPNVSGTVVFTAIEDGIWARVTTGSGERIFDGTMKKGQKFAVPADAVDPRINTARPHQLEITIDGKAIPKLADKQVILGDTSVSAEALLARVNAPAGAATAAN